jgi:hypothetical protein
MKLGKQKYTQQNQKCLSLVPLEVKLATEKLKSHKSPGIDQFPAELIKAVGRKIRY